MSNDPEKTAAGEAEDTSASKPQKSASKPRKPAPKTRKPASKTSKPAPKARKATPKARKPAPKARKGAPKARKLAPEAEKTTPPRSDQVPIRLPSGEQAWVSADAFNLISEKEFRDSERLRRLRGQRNLAVAVAAVAVILLAAVVISLSTRRDWLGAFGIRSGKQAVVRAPAPDLGPEAPRVPVTDRGGPPVEAMAVEESAALLVEGARISVRKAPKHDTSYRFISYPGGDPGWERGSGADVVVRAYRHLGIDLQEKVHEDILAAASDYGVQAPDTHIDHRRIRNLEIFLRRHGRELAIDPAADWRPGDIVFWAVAGRRDGDHVGIVSDRRGPGDVPMVIHHRAGGPPLEEDVLLAWTVRGHHRWLP